MKDNNEYEKGDLTLTNIKRVYKTGVNNSISQKERNIIIGDRLKKIRAQKGITQKELCENINVVITTYYKGTALEGTNKKLEEYLENTASENESDINYI